MVKGICHCGAVKWRLTEEPARIVSCTCSMCHRYGAAWAHMTEATVELEGAPEATASYVHGDGVIRFHHCVTCGCVTHYTSIPGGNPDDRLAVNMRMAARADMERYPHRLFDGADTWEFLD